MEKILVSDFDGTMTKRDFFQLALVHTPEKAALWKEFESGRLTHFEALQGIFSALKIRPRDFEAILTGMQPEPGLRTATEQLRRCGWSTVIASAGCEAYIRRIIVSIGFEAVLHANPGVFQPGRGLKMEAPLHSPFYCPDTGIDKMALVKHYRENSLEIAFAGDGRPDLAPALLVPATRRFARGWLAEELERRGEPYIRFKAWHEIADCLCRESP